MARPKRGKIPQSDWPLIMARYEAGETLSSIGRTYDCSPPAISYVVTRSRARHPTATSTALAPATPPLTTQPQLIKAKPSRAAAASEGIRAPPLIEALGLTESPARNGHAVQPSAEVQSSEGHRDEPWARHSEQNAGGFIAPAHHPASVPSPAQTHLSARHGNREHRPKLHLSVGAQATGETHSAGSAQVKRPTQPTPQPRPTHDVRRSNSQIDASRGSVQPASDYALASRAGGVSGSFSNGHSPPSAHRHGNGAGKQGSVALIDRELRARVEADIAAFLSAFDSALAEDTQENRSALREGTDRLLRAGACTRIELERLEARMPMPPRDPAKRQAGWQHRY